MNPIRDEWTSDDGQHRILLGDCLEILPTLDADLFDAIVTDPPAGIGFMGKEWDHDRGGRDAWINWMTAVAFEMFAVLKPGAHALVWALPRTSHWTATALEDAGFEVRDRISHLFGSGFPKSLDVSKAIDKAAGAERTEVIGKGWHASTRGAEGVTMGRFAEEYQPGTSGMTRDVLGPATPDAERWQGWGTALKPACEDWWLVRKPLSEKTIAANVLRWGTGALNVDGCRVEVDPSVDDMLREVTRKPRQSMTCEEGSGFKNETNARTGIPSNGRWPANVTHDGSEEVLAGFPETGNGYRYNPSFADSRDSITGWNHGLRGERGHNDSGSAARFFYCSKASRADRGENNKHPTVKNTALMRWLCRLITPPGGLILDCFMGSGSTAEAALDENFRFVGIEQEEEYYRTAIGRMKREAARQPLLEKQPLQQRRLLT